MHTTVSDGVWKREELFDYLREGGFEAFSITDHDAIDAYPVPVDLVERCIPGIEVDTKCNGVTARLLCYGIRTPDAPLLQRLRAQRAARKVRMEEIIAQLRRRGVDISLHDVERQADAAASLGRPHLARALVERGVVATVQEAFDRLIADEGDAYVSLDRLESAEAIRLAHESKAIVSIAHPTRLKSAASLDALREAGADAMEVVHPTADEALRSELSGYAEPHGLLETGGSDFHAPSPGYAPGISYQSSVFERFITNLTGRRYLL